MPSSSLDPHHLHIEVILDAPNYPPAAAYEQPQASASAWRLEQVSLLELMSHPAARDIIVKHVPAITSMLGSPMLKPHLGNMTVYSLESFGKVLPAKLLAAIDAELAHLPPIEAAAP